MDAGKTNSYIPENKHKIANCKKKPTEDWVIGLPFNCNGQSLNISVLYPVEVSFRSFIFLIDRKVVTDET
jgi:hypothetical protein